MIMNLLAWDPIDKKMGVVETYHPKTGKVMFENDKWDWYKRDRVVRRPTGLKDKNGMEIYEGDIVTAREKSSMAPFTGYVHYLNAQYWVNYIGYESYYIPLTQLHGAEYKPIEVIGNIYESPELLEVQA